jgi:hypothetical protein
MIYKLFRSTEGAITLIPECDEIKQIAQRDGGDEEIGEINSEAYEDEDYIWPDILEQMQAWETS